MQLDASHVMGLCKVTVYDLEGRILHHETIDTSGASLHYDLDFSKFASGTYALAVETNDGMHTIKQFTLD